MSSRLGNPQEGSSQHSESIQAFCRHLGELCDALAAPYNGNEVDEAAVAASLQGTNCNLLLQNALFYWLGERVEVSLVEGDVSGQSVHDVTKAVLEKIQQQDLLTEFVDTVADSCLNADATVEARPQRPKNSLLFDLQGPIDLLGPEEVDGLLQELSASDAPVTALEALVGDVHLLEDLCFGPSWPQLCDSLGRLVRLQAASSSPAGPSGHPTADDPAPHRDVGLDAGQAAQRRVEHPEGSAGAAVDGEQRGKQQRLLLKVLQELASSTAASSPPHAAELLEALAPYLCTLALRVPLGGAEAGQHAGGAATAPTLMATATALYPFATGVARVIHQLLVGLAAEFHILPLVCASMAARAVCQIAHAGLARGAPPPPPPPPPAQDPSSPTEKWAVPTSAAAAAAAAAAQSRGRWDSNPVGSVDLSALDLLVLLDPELRWWRRLCAATHATQAVAAESAAAQLPGALEAALAAWAGALATARPAQLESGANHTGGRSSGRVLDHCSSSHLVSCTSLLAGLVCANNPALWGCGPDGGAGCGDAEARDGRGGGAADRGTAAGGSVVGSSGGGGSGGVAPQAGGTAAPADGAATTSDACAPGQAQGHDQAGLLRVRRLLGHLAACFCALAENPGLLRPRGCSAAATAAGLAGRGSEPEREDGGGRGPRGSVFLYLAADVLAAAASHGLVTLAAPAASPATATGTLAPVLQAMLRAAASTAAAAASAAVGSPASPAGVWEVEAWLAAAASVLRAASEHAGLRAAAPSPAPAPAPPTTPPPAASEPLCSLLRHIAGRVRGCAGGAPLVTGWVPSGFSDSAAPAWACEVVRGAAALAPASPAVAAALADLYDTVDAVLASRHRAAAATAVMAGEAAPGALLSSPLRDASRSPASALLAVLDGAPPCLPLAASAGSAGSVNGGDDCSDGAVPAEPLMDGVEALAAHAILAHCLSPTGDWDGAGGGTGSRTGANPGQPLWPVLPAALQRETFLRSAARLLCAMYDSGGGAVAASVGGGVATASAPSTGAGCAGAALKRRAVRVAGFVARSCLAGQRALVGSGFARRVLNDVAAVLRSGEYVSPYLEPLPYADPLAAYGAALADVLCWPGLLLVAPPDAGSPGEREEGASGPGRGQGLEEHAGGICPHRAEVLTLLQELVTWLDPSCGRGGEDAAGERQGPCLPPQDAAVVSLRCFSALVAADSAAAVALERDTNIRWYLQNLTGTLPDGPSTQAPQHDLLLDLARGLLTAMDSYGAQAGAEA